MKVEAAEIYSEKLEQELNLLRVRRALSRRRFVQSLGVAGAGVAAMSMVGCSSDAFTQAMVSEADVLNFALNLEYLEAEFYLIAVDGARLGAGDTGAATGQTTGGAQVSFADSQLRDIADEIKADEVSHVRFLRSALGTGAVPKPAINLNALGVGFANDAEFLTLARAFEDAGVSAYAGAARLLSGANLEAAAQILATEAYHAGNVRLQVVQKGITTTPLDSLDQPPAGSNFFPTDNNGLAIKRTTSQILAIVYASAVAGTASGGFFPNGLNGTIKTV